MKNVPSAVWALLLFLLFWLFFRFGIAPLTELLTETAAPLPSSLVLMYTGMAGLGILIFVSVREDRWERFRDPVIEFLRDPRPASSVRRTTRALFFTLLPPVVGWWAYDRAAARPEPPADPPGIHFNLPDDYLALANPFPWTEENIREGGILYTANCAMCHGDAQDGEGLYARVWQPKPADFRGSATIAQLDENYLFWRIKEGGPGIRRGGGAVHYRSAMPVWDGVLTDDEIWKIIMFEYTNAGQMPAKRGEP